MQQNKTTTLVPLKSNASKSTPRPRKKRPAPAHSEIQTRVIKMVAEHYNINYPQAMKKLKEVMAKALGAPYAEMKKKGMTYIEALEKTESYLLKSKKKM